jgi:uncharacterized protein (TIGR02996 family)
MARGDTAKVMAMTDGEAFLRTIRAKPADDGPRLVYADWLEEHGDPLGEVIRLGVSASQPHRPLLYVGNRRLAQRDGRTFVAGELLAKQVRELRLLSLDCVPPPRNQHRMLARSDLRQLPPTFDVEGVGEVMLYAMSDFGNSQPVTAFLEPTFAPIDKRRLAVETAEDRLLALETVAADQSGKPHCIWQALYGLPITAAEFKADATARSDNGPRYVVLKEFSQPESVIIERGLVAVIVACWEWVHDHLDAVLARHPVSLVRLTTWPEEYEGVHMTHDEATLAQFFAGKWPGVEFLLPDDSLGLLVRSLERGYLISLPQGLILEPANQSAASHAVELQSFAERGLDWHRYVDDLMRENEEVARLGLAVRPPQPPHGAH